MNKSIFPMLPALFLLAGCGGSSDSPSTVTHTTSYAGSYAANLTGPSSSALLVSLQTDGSATVVIAGSNGILASGTGTVTGNTLAVKASGSAGTFQVSTTFGSGNAAVSQVTGSATDNNISDIKFAGAGQSPFAGTYTSGFAGSDTGTASMMITPSGGLSGSGKDSAGHATSFIGSSLLTGLVSFTGSVSVSGSTVTLTFTGSLYVTQLLSGAGPRIMGSGTWKNSHGGSGTWSAMNIIG